MRVASALFICGLVTSLGIAQEPTGLSGGWTVKTNFEWLPPFDCRFELRETKLTGTCDLAGNAYEVVQGVATAERVTWAFDVPGSAPNGATVRYSFSGTLDSGTGNMRGSVVGSDSSRTLPDQVGNFTATRRQEAG